MTDEIKNKSGDPEFGGYWHIRMEDQLELLGTLYWITGQDGIERSVLFKPIRVLYDNGDGGLGVRFAPFSMFSDEEFFSFEVSDTSFMAELNERSAYRYTEFCNQYEAAMEELHEEPEDDIESAPATGSVIH